MALSFADGTGLPTIPSTKISTGTWSVVLGSGPGAINSSGISSGIMAGLGSYRLWLSIRWVGGMDCGMVILFHLADGEGGCTVIQDPVHIPLEAPSRSVSGQAHSHLHVETCPEKHKQAFVLIVDQMV